jgi:hypothetical protein
METGSAKSYYTKEELLANIAGEFTLGDEELQQRIDEEYQNFLESETYQYLINVRLREVYKAYPDVLFDYDTMIQMISNLSGARVKFDSLRSLNRGAEEEATKRYLQPEVGRSEHFSRLMSFYYSFTNSLGKEYEPELKLIKQLVDVLNDEFNYGVENIPNLFAEGVGHAIGSIASLLGDAVNGLAKGLGIDPDLLKAIIIGIIVVAGIGVGASIVAKLRKRREARDRR